MRKQRGLFFQGFRIMCVVIVSMATVAVPTWASHRDDVIHQGFFVTTALGADRGFDITGRLMLIRRGDGTTEAYTQVLGLDPLTTYASHVHNLPCSLGGGGHYKIDPTIGVEIRANEIWPTLTSDSDGTAHGSDIVDHKARPEAQSVVVHDPLDGGRLACGDLFPDRSGAVVTKGTVRDFAAASGTIRGEAQMVRSHGTTFVTIRVHEGLAPSTAHPVHVHELPCDVDDAGGHYKIDPFEPLTLRENEIWPEFTTDGDGVGVGQVAVSHLARPEAQSVVVHAPGGAKIACANLTGPKPVPNVTSGRFITTALGLERGFKIDGSLSLIRTGSGKTIARVNVSGLDRFTTYPAHVHDRPCRLGGGGHYKIDPDEPLTIEANEIWPTVRTGRSGRGSGFDVVRHTARPEAQSVVIHDPDDGARLACGDLDQ